MPLELAADQGHVLGTLGKAERGAMHRHEAVAGLDIRHQCGLLLRRDHRPIRIDQQGVVAVERRSVQVFQLVTVRNVDAARGQMRNKHRGEPGWLMMTVIAKKQHLDPRRFGSLTERRQA